MTTVYKREAVFIPIKDLTPKQCDRVQDKLRFRFYEERACKTCENLSERHSDLCDVCPAYKGGYDLGPKVKIGAKRYLKVPVGAFDRIQNYLELQGHEIHVVDKTPRGKDIRKINFTGTLKPEQASALKVLVKTKRGVLQAPPRSGKTVLGTAFICKASKKTLILASQRDWLDGFLETFIGSATQEALTDIKPSRIGFCKTLKDFQEKDVCLATVQTFYSPAGQKLLRKIRSLFEVVVVDETHFGAADRFIRILASLNARAMITLTATPDRKDGKFILVENVVGKVIYEIKVESLRPRVLLTRTGFSKKVGRGRWDQMVSSLEGDKARAKVIAAQVIKDVKAGHMVFIPMASLRGIDLVVRTINEMAGKRLAHRFTGKEAKIRKEIIQKARDYKIKVLVGTMKILSTGINVPRASMLYEVSMSSNKVNAEQRMRRVCTPYEGKPDPCIRYFMDDYSVRKSCMRNEFYQVMLPKIKPIISDRDRMLLNSYFSDKEQHERFDL